MFTQYGPEIEAELAHRRERLLSQGARTPGRARLAPPRALRHVLEPPLSVARCPTQVSR